MKKNIASFIYGFFSLFVLNAQIPVEGTFFEDCNRFFEKYVQEGNVNYSAIKEKPNELFALIKTIDNASIQYLEKDAAKAFYINAYNLNVIKGVTLNYPISSVMDINGFFDKETHIIAQEKMTLNDLENNIIRPTYNDARTHFALVCGAVGCPPIINQAYKPQNVDELLEQQTRIAINNSDFTKIETNKASISKIFEWYAQDFGKGKSGLISFLNQYLETPLANNAKISYYDYNWQLNEGNFEIANTQSMNNVVPEIGLPKSAPENITILPVPNSTQELDRYYVSALYEKGQFEVNIFNNIFTDKTKNLLDDGDKFSGRNTFFTSYINALFGINNRFNIGFDSKIRSVANNTQTAAQPLEFLNFANNDVNETGSYNRFQQTAFGPRVKYTPFKKFGNISVQQTLYLPLGKNLEGGNGKGFADWQGVSLWNQLFYDTQIGDKFALFAEVDIFLENFTAAFTDNYFWQFSTPMTIIPSYFPTPKIIVYALIGSAPQWQFSKSAGFESNKTYAPYNQYGLGFKYQITSNWLAEVLYTEFIKDSATTSRTFNFGIRYIKR